MLRIGVMLACVASCGAPSRSSPPRADDGDALGKAVWRGDTAAVHRLLDAGADPDAGEEPPWMRALFANDERPMLELLVGRTHRITRHDLTMGVALWTAAARDDRWLVAALLDRGVPVDLAAHDGRTSALLTAAANGHLEMMQLLVERGARVDFADDQGDTPLMAATRAGCVRCVDFLIATHANVKATDREGRSAAAWAAITDQPSLAAKLVEVGAPPMMPHRTPTSASRDAIARAIPVLEHGIAHWMDKPRCGSCHHHPMYVQVAALAEQRGVAHDRELQHKVMEAWTGFDHEFGTELRAAPHDADSVNAESMERHGDGPFGLIWFVSADLDLGTPRSPDMEAQALAIARMQRPDGHWRVGPLRGVLEQSEIETTALGARVLAGYAPDSPEIRAAIERARAFVRTARPVTEIDHIYRLRGLAWTNASPAELASAVDEVRRHQRADGGWGHLPEAPSDALTTGLALIALHRDGGVRSDDPVYRRGVDYLLRTQEDDGSWIVHSRAPPLLRRQETGFPHGKLQFVSFAGTAYATLALLETL